MSEFYRLAAKYGCDKGPGHRYDFAYSRLLKPYRELGRPVRMLEIGIERGASLRVWQDYFAGRRFELFAIELDAEKVTNAPSGVRVFQGDQGDAGFLLKFIEKTEVNFDIIIDDGSHRCVDQQITFQILWPHVAPGGLYVIEDLETSKMHKHKRATQRQGFATTLNWLLDTIEGSIIRRRRKQIPTTYAFAGNACFIVKGDPNE